MKKHFFPTGITFGFLLLSLLVFGVGGYHFQTGLPRMVMLFGSLLFGYLTFVFFHLVITFLAKRVPKSSLSFNIGLNTVVLTLVVAKTFLFRWPDDVYFIGMMIVILAIVVLVKSLQHISNNKISWIGLIGSSLFFLGGLYWLFQSGSDPYAKNLPQPFLKSKVPLLSEKSIENPAENGIYKIRKFTYGSGDDQKRKIYREEVKFITPKVDASKLLPEWKDKKKKWRERYWGFGVNNFPLNGRVYMPEGNGPFPLILIVHGNHSMIDYSDGGYAYLGELLASRGYITIAVDENFINAHWSGDFRGKEMPVRAWLLLKHLEQWRQWNSTPGHELANKINMNQIMLVGHSRGGEAVSIAAVYNQLDYFPDNALERFDFNFDIKGVVSIAPTDYRYHRKIKLENVNYLSLQGAYDADEVSFWGMRPYHRLKFTNDKIWFKAGVYIHRANHGQFNSSWGRADMGAPFKWLLNTKPLISGEDQRQAAKVFISAFAEAALKENNSYLPIFKNAAIARNWLPKNYYLTHFRNSQCQTLVDFEEDINPATGSDQIKIKAENFKIWREENLATRDKGSQENNVAVLGWDYGEKMKKDSIAVYSIRLPDSLKVQKDTVTYFFLSIAAGNQKELKKEKKGKEHKNKSQGELLDFIIQIKDRNNNIASIAVNDMKSITPPLKVQFTKLKSLDKDMMGSNWEVHLESFFIPLDAFKTKDDHFNLKDLEEIRFIFNKSKKGVIVIDEIGIEGL